MSAFNVISPAAAEQQGISARSLDACADWSDRAGENAYRNREYDDAKRLKLQADVLRVVAHALRTSKAA